LNNLAPNVLTPVSSTGVETNLIVTSLVAKRVMSDPLRARRALRRVVWARACLTLLALVSAVAVSASALPSASAQVSACSLADSPAAAPPTFRLGNAARPFGWSTVIGDFDRDGRPDVVVADHATRRPTGYAYRIEFSLSGQATYDVKFESAQPAVTLTVSDIDNDDDLDVLVGAAPSGERVGIWLNDGRGHFTSTALQQVRASIGPVQTLRTPEQSLESSSVDLSAKRAGDALAGGSWTAASGSNDQSIAGCRQRVPSPFRCSQAGPRAPPQPLPDFRF
jgi:hypothetical protein